MEININVLVGKLSQKIANLEVDNALKEAQIEGLQHELEKLKIEKVEDQSDQ